MFSHRIPWQFSRRFRLKAFPSRLPPTISAGRGASNTAQTELVARRPRYFAYGLGGALALGCLDEGFRRCIEFWVVVFPLWCHYFWVDKVSHPKGGPKGDEQRDAEFSKLHARYSPIIRRATLYMRGFYLKAAQLVSTRDDFLPEIYLEWLRKLQDEVPMTLSSEEAKQVITKELKVANIEELLTDWQDEPIGTASIGQVYKARLKSTGEEVAIKVQVPKAERMFRADISCLKMFTYMAIPWAYENMKEIEKLFETEFDYTEEFRNLEAMRSNLLPNWGHRIYIPRPIPELCSRHVLGMELLKGEKFITAVRRRLQPLAEQRGITVEEYEQEQLEALRTGKRKAESAAWLHWKITLWKFWRRLCGFKSDLEPIDVGGIFEMLMSIHGQQVLKDGCFNADPHPGNILMLEDGKTLGLIDFGQVMYVPVEFRLKLARLMLALSRRSPPDVARCESEIGVTRKYYKEDVQYRICSFWLDRDDDEITEGRNIFDLMVWGEAEADSPSAAFGPVESTVMSSFHELLSQLQVRYESDVASLTSQCHRLLRENVELRQEQEPEVPSEIALQTTAEADLAPVSNRRTGASSPFKAQREAGRQSSCARDRQVVGMVVVVGRAKTQWFHLQACGVEKLLVSVDLGNLGQCIFHHTIDRRLAIPDISLAEEAGGPGALLNVELFCLTFYIVELILRLVVHRLYFFINDNLAWRLVVNWLDLLLVAFSIIEIIVIWRTDGESGTILYMRTLRVCKELAGLLENLRSSLMAMFWSLALLSFLLFLSALVFAQGVADGLSDAVFPASDAKQLGFGSVADTMVLLYMSVTGGTDWHLYYDLLKMLGSFYHWLYLGFIFFFTFALFNILTATFVEKAVDASRPDRQQQMVLERRKFAEQAAELRELFSKMDRDNNGRITKEEFDECLEDGEVLSHMLSVGLDVYDAHYLFELVADQTGELEISRFVDGCMAVKGSASALDIQKQMVLIAQLESRLDSWEKDYWPPIMSFAAGVHLKL
eukprot:s2444_g9.t1